jgi:hypothetical protein
MLKNVLDAFVGLFTYVYVLRILVSSTFILESATTRRHLFPPAPLVIDFVIQPLQWEPLVIRSDCLGFCSYLYQVNLSFDVK